MGRDWDVSRKEMDMGVCLGGVTGGAGVTPGENIAGQVWPDVVGGNKAASGQTAWVGKVM